MLAGVAKYSEKSQTSYDAILEASELPENAHIKLSIEILEKALRLYRIDEKELWISFNGGKDSVVALQLFRIALYKTIRLSNKSQSELQLLNAMYFEEEDSFEEMDSFIEFMVSSCNLNLRRMKKNYSLIQTLVDNENLKAIVMGTRNTDPKCGKLEYFSPSDFQKGFPLFMRINPIIYWNYEQIWTFIKKFGFPYCSLYDEGYTYLGNKKNSFKNETLLTQEGKYLPAYMCEGTFERHSRNSVQKEYTAGSKAQGKIVVYDSTEGVLDFASLDLNYSPLVFLDCSKGNVQPLIIEHLAKEKCLVQFKASKENEYTLMIKNVCKLFDCTFL